MTVGNLVGHRDEEDDNVKIKGIRAGRESTKGSPAHQGMAVMSKIRPEMEDHESL